MKSRIVSNWRALIGFALLAALYLVSPLDAFPGPIDDMVAVPLLCLLAYAKGTSPKLQSGVA